jgi:hypothetical protein
MVKLKRENLIIVVGKSLQVLMDLGFEENAVHSTYQGIPANSRKKP